MSANTFLIECRKCKLLKTFTAFPSSESKAAFQYLSLSLKYINSLTFTHFYVSSQVFHSTQSTIFFIVTQARHRKTHTEKIQNSFWKDVVWTVLWWCHISSNYKYICLDTPMAHLGRSVAYCTILLSLPVCSVLFNEGLYNSIVIDCRELTRTNMHTEEERACSLIALGLLQSVNE